MKYLKDKYRELHEAEQTETEAGYSLLCVVADNIPGYEIRSVRVDESTESSAITPGAGHVGDADSRITVEQEPAPLLQSLAS